MTVVDRRRGAIAEAAAGPDNADSLAAALAPLLLVAGRTADRRPLVWTSRSIDAIDPIALFAAARSLDLEAALWLQPAADRSIVAIGRAWAVEAAGPDRFAESATAWRGVLADAIGSSSAARTPEAGPTLLGGLGFSGRVPARDDPWAPFGAASLVLPEFAIARSGARTTLTAAIAPGRDAVPEPDEVERVWLAVAEAAHAQEASWHRQAAEQGSTAPTKARLRVTEECPARPDWERTVGMLAGAVGRGRIDKVVLARSVTMVGGGDLDVVDALRLLAASAPESTTFAFVRGGLTFLGATPERLARTVGRSFETVAIAGSTARSAEPEEDARLAAALLASEKEREEHAVVVDTLRANLVPLAETLEMADTPAILPLRHIQHLATRITGTLREDAGLLALAAQLHPTPAVGGAPRELALELIHEHEDFDRGWYAGPIGWLGADGDGELMVALRCGLVDGPQARLFAGCGIVADSDPAREWDESRLKLRTMTVALGADLGTIGDRAAGEPR